MKKTTKLKAFALSLAMALGVLLPNTSFGQSEDFFRASDNYGGNRFATDWAIINNGIGQSELGVSITNNGIGQGEAPLGSGLLILTAVGAGYALVCRKRDDISDIMP